MEKFTKGEWEVFTTNIYPEIGIGHQAVASTQTNKYINNGIDKDESIANAHLIAAAPDMYDMLERLEGITQGILIDEIVEEIGEVLAKARGE